MSCGSCDYVRWENPPPGYCQQNPTSHYGLHHWHCSPNENADTCVYCGMYRSPCRHAASTRAHCLQVCCTRNLPAALVPTEH